MTTALSASSNPAAPSPARAALRIGRALRRLRDRVWSRVLLRVWRPARFPPGSVASLDPEAARAVVRAIRYYMRHAHPEIISLEGRVLIETHARLVASLPPTPPAQRQEP